MGNRTCTSGSSVEKCTVLLLAGASMCLIRIPLGRSDSTNPEAVAARYYVSVDGDD